MPKIQSKQVKKILTGAIKITGVSASSSTSSTNITSAITSALTVAGDGSTSVPLQVSSAVTMSGVITSTPMNRVDIWDNTTLEKITGANDKEVYGRITQSGGVYTLSYYYLAGGSETPYTFTSNTTIQFDFNYRFEFHQAPADIIISQLTRNVNQDSGGAGSIARLELLTVSALNTVNALSIATSDSTKVKLFVNGKQEDTLGGSPSFTISGGINITWNSGNAGYSLDTSDKVVAEYPV